MFITHIKLIYDSGLLMNLKKNKGEVNDHISRAMVILKGVGLGTYGFTQPAQGRSRLSFFRTPSNVISGVTYFENVIIWFKMPKGEYTHHMLIQIETTYSEQKDNIHLVKNHPGSYRKVRISSLRLHLQSRFTNR